MKIKWLGKVLDFEYNEKGKGYRNEDYVLLYKDNTLFKCKIKSKRGLIFKWVKVNKKDYEVIKEER